MTTQKKINQSYYVEIKHPITGECIAGVPTGQTRTTTTSEREIEVTIITPKSNLGKIWIQRRDLFEK